MCYCTIQSDEPVYPRGLWLAQTPTVIVPTASAYAALYAFSGQMMPGLTGGACRTVSGRPYSSKRMLLLCDDADTEEVSRPKLPLVLHI